ncbi:MAG: hypothetical protein HQL21_03985 [Candidatus Omnitrophica bacterium]|nr:hypothetical protein [Candidatus Omnitrophota bacterium]
MKFVQLPLLKIILSVIALTTLVLIIYQPCALDYARQDQLVYIQERTYFPNDWDWLFHSISYNRTRLHGQGDYFLFRPGLHVFNAFNDIYLKDNQIVTGVLSIVLHLLITILLYFLFKKYFVESPAFLFSAFFASQYAGLEMVAWRHISFYMLGILLLLICLLLTSSKTRQQNFIISIIMAESMLFHEIISVSVFLLILPLALITTIKNQTKTDKHRTTHRLVYISIGALIIYFLLDGINWWITKPPSLLSPTDHFPKNYGYAIKNFFLYLGAGTQATFNPFSINMLWVHDRFSWIISKINTQELFLWATGATGAILTVACLCLHRIFHRKETLQDLLSLWACCGIVSITAIFSFARATLRNSHYLDSQTYNYWFFSLFYTIIITYLFHKIFEKASLPSQWRMIIRSSAFVFLSVVILAQGWMTRSTISKNYNLTRARQIRNAILEGKKYFASNPDSCIDQNEPEEQKLGTIMKYLYKYRCDRRPGSSMVYTILNKNGSIQFKLRP